MQPKPFTTIEAASEFTKSAPLDGDTFELSMSNGYTFLGEPDRSMGPYTLGMVSLITYLFQRDFEPAGSEQFEGFQTFRFARIRMSAASEVPFPDGFAPERVALANADEIAARTPAEILRYFEGHPEAADELIVESANKHYSPATFVEQRHDGFRVGWSDGTEVQCVQTFATRADAVTDYLLFTLGKGRWFGRTAAA